MASKSELKEQCKTLAENLETWQLIADGRLQQIETLTEQIERAKKTENEFWYSYQNEAKRAQFYWNCLSKIRHILALDTVEQLTHRMRNDKMRSLVGTIAQWMETVVYSRENDDIPF